MGAKKLEEMLPAVPAVFCTQYVGQSLPYVNKHSPRLGSECSDETKASTNDGATQRQGGWGVDEIALEALFSSCRR